jgi:hypothetical protein
MGERTIGRTSGTPNRVGDRNAYFLEGRMHGRREIQCDSSACGSTSDKRTVLVAHQTQLRFPELVALGVNTGPEFGANFARTESTHVLNGSFQHPIQQAPPTGMRNSNDLCIDASKYHRRTVSGHHSKSATGGRSDGGVGGSPRPLLRRGHHNHVGSMLLAKPTNGMGNDSRKQGPMLFQQQAVV